MREHPITLVESEIWSQLDPVGGHRRPRDGPSGRLPQDQNRPAANRQGSSAHPTADVSPVACARSRAPFPIQPVPRRRQMEVDRVVVGAKQMKKLSSVILLPRVSVSPIPSPLRNTARDLPKPLCQSSVVISCPAGVSHAMSSVWSPHRIGTPAKNRRLRSTGCFVRNAMALRVKVSRSQFFSASDQSIHASGESWQYIVVAVLCAADLVAVREHQGALGQEERGQHITLLPGPKFQDVRVVGGALDAAVPRPVVALAIAVALAVGLVVFSLYDTRSAT